MDYNQYKNKFFKFIDKSLFPQQIEGISWFSTVHRKVSLLCAPTGSGKSLLAATISAMQPTKPVLYLCSSIMLQHQIEKDFPEFKVMFGRSNFPCNLIPGRTAADCPYIGLKEAKQNCIEENGCPYEKRKHEVLASDYQCLNYTYFLFESNYVGRFSKYSLIICDEADVLEKVITNFIKLNISENILKKFRLPLPKFKTATAKNGVASWKEWAEVVNEKISSKLPDESANLSDYPDDELRKIKKYRALLSQVSIFKSQVDETWLYQERKGVFKSHVFYPTWLSEKLTTDYFWRHSKKFLLMSATFPSLRVFGKQLGISLDKLEYKELPSTFPIKNRRIYLDPTIKITRKTLGDKSTLPKLLNKIKELINSHPNEKGLIHCVNYQLASEIGKINPERMILHNGQDKIDKLELFMRSENPLIFVSPSSTRGLDLKFDLCRFIIFAKAPFQSLGDKLVSNRVYGSGPLGQEWYQSDMLLEIVQGCGRANRTKDDFSVTYILDTIAVNAIQDNRDKLPNWWLEAIDIKW